MTAQTSDLPLWPGDELALVHPQGKGWISYSRRYAELPPGRASGPTCGQYCSLPGFPPVVCTDHGDGYHAASVPSPDGYRVIAVWLDETAAAS